MKKIHFNGKTKIPFFKKNKALQPKLLFCNFMIKKLSQS